MYDDIKLEVNEIHKSCILIWNCMQSYCWIIFFGYFILQKTRRNHNEKIAKLNDAIDNVAAQLKAENGTAFSDDNVVKLEFAAK